VDVLVSGHTHRFQAQEYEGRYFINPGSATGAWHGASTEDPTPSFALMDIQGTVIVTYVYQLIEGEVRVEKMEYRKPIASVPVSVGGVGEVGSGSGSGSVGRVGFTGSGTGAGIGTGTGTGTGSGIGIGIGIGSGTGAGVGTGSGSSLSSSSSASISGRTTPKTASVQQSSPWS